MKDKQIIEAVIKEWRCGAGAGIVAPAAISVLQRLTTAYGDEATIDGVCDAMERLSKVSMDIRNNLRELQTKNQQS